MQVIVRRTRRNWTAEDDTKLRLLYGTKTYKQLAVYFKRHFQAVFNRAKILGLTKPARKWDEERKQRLRDLHAKGMSDRMIAGCMNTTPGTIMVYRQRIGLPGHGITPIKRRMLKRNYQDFCDRMNICNLAELKPRKFHNIAFAEDLPPAKSMEELKILRALRSGGPATYVELAQRINHTARYTNMARKMRKLLKRNCIRKIGKKQRRWVVALNK